MEPSTSTLQYHDITFGDVKTLKAVNVTTESEATQAAVTALNVFLRDMAMGNVLVPGMNPQLGQNPRSDRFNSFKEQGNTHFRQGKNDEAIKLYTLAAQMAATRPAFENSAYAREELAVALNNRSAAYLQAGDHLNALVDADASLKMKPNLPKAHFRKGKSLIAAGRLDEAREAYLLGLEFDPANEDLLTALGEVENTLSPPQASEQPAEEPEKADEETAVEAS